jgi:hypothetical protein
MVCRRHQRLPFPEPSNFGGTQRNKVETSARALPSLKRWVRIATDEAGFDAGQHRGASTGMRRLRVRRLSETSRALPGYSRPGLKTKSSPSRRDGEFVLCDGAAA